MDVFSEHYNFSFCTLMLLLGDRKGIVPIKTSSKLFGMALNVSGQGAAQSTI